MGQREERSAWDGAGTGKGRGGRPGVSPALQLSNFPESSTAQESPSSHSRLPPVSGMEDAEPGWLPPPFPPGSLHARRGGLGSPLSGLELRRPPAGRGSPWMSPRNFPERARKSCMVSNHFPSCSLPFVSVQIFSSLLLLLTLLSPPPPANNPRGRKNPTGQGNKGPARRLWVWGSFLALWGEGGAFQEGRIVLFRH